MTFPDAFVAKVAAVVRCLESQSIPYAVGGAICLGYHTEPRGTTDIDVDIFLAPGAARMVIETLLEADLRVEPDRTMEAIERDGQARLLLGETYLDLFFAYHPFHDSCARRAVRVSFQDSPMNILAAEDIVVFKVLFNRSHDWIDIQKVLGSNRDAFDIAYARQWLIEILGSDDSRVARLDALFTTARESEEPRS